LKPFFLHKCLAPNGSAQAALSAQKRTPSILQTGSLVWNACGRRPSPPTLPDKHRQQPEPAPLPKTEDMTADTTAVTLPLELPLGRHPRRRAAHQRRPSYEHRVKFDHSGEHPAEFVRALTEAA
jgi:hypothetical protein